MSESRYEWKLDSTFTMDGKQFEIVYNYIMTQVSKEMGNPKLSEYERILMLNAAQMAVQKMFEDSKESGVIYTVGADENPVLQEALEPNVKSIQPINPKG